MRTCEITLDIFGTCDQCELEIERYQEDTIAAVQTCVARALNDEVPAAHLASIFIARETRVEFGRVEPGYLVSLSVLAPLPGAQDDQHNSAEARKLRNRVESAVAVGLTQLLRELTVVTAGAR